MDVNPKKFFKTIFLEEVRQFLKIIDNKAVSKIFYNVASAEQTNDPELFKKLTNDIWKFRTRFGNLQYRLLAFWDKTEKDCTLVVATHGMIKKTARMPVKEIKKAEKIRC